MDVQYLGIWWGEMSDDRLDGGKYLLIWVGALFLDWRVCRAVSVEHSDDLDELVLDLSGD